MSAGSPSREGEGPDDDHLFTRDVQPMEVPDRIYALGGGGMQMVIEMFDQKWFAVEAMRNRDRKISVYLLDTATEHNVESDVEKLQRKVDSLEGRLRERTDQNVATIELNYVNVTRSYTIQNFADLAGDSATDQILDNTDATHWWVNREHLQSQRGRGLYDISKGVIKRRSLGKAMHYKALSVDVGYDDIFRGPAQDRVAVFAGIGGGTGSGILIDVAKRISDHQQSTEVTVFATLPTTREHTNAKANAFAALGELEYLQLKEGSQDNDGTQDNPISNVMLLPLEPTEHSQGTTETEELKQFDRALSYAVAGYYNNPDYDYAINLNTPYTPFTLAVPQVIHYSRDETAAAKNRALEMLKTKRALLNREYRVWNDIDLYLDEHFPEVDGRDVEESDFDRTALNHLHDRFKAFERLVEFDLFDLLDFEVATESGEEIVSSIYGEFDRRNYSLEEVLEERNIGDVIEDMVLYAAGEDESRGLVDDRNDLKEDFLRSILYTELHRIEELYEKLCRLEEVKQTEGDDLAAGLLKYLLLPSLGEQKGRERLKAVRRAYSDLEDEISDLGSRITRLDTEIEDTRDDRNRRINSLTGEWYERAEDDIEKYATLERLDLESALARLNSQLDSFARAIEGDGDSRLTDRSGVGDALDDVDELVGRVDGLEFAERSEIENDLGTLQAIREDWDSIVEAANEGGGLFGGDPEIDDQRQDYIQTQRSLKYFDTPSPPPTPEKARSSTFTAEVNYDPRDEQHVLAEVSVQKSNAKTRIVGAFRETMSALDGGGGRGQADSSQLALTSESDSGRTSAGTDTRTDIDDVLEASSAEALESELESAVRDAIAGELGDDVPELKEQRKQLEEQRTERETDKEHLEALEQLFEQRAKDAKQIIEDHQSYRTILRRGVKQDSGVKGIKLASHFVQDVDPKDIEKAMEKRSLNDPGLLDGGEKKRIKRYFQRIVNNRFVNNRYNGLSRNTLSERNNFTDTAVNFAVMGEAIGNGAESSLNEEDFGFGDSINDNRQRSFRSQFNIESDDNYEEWLVSNSDPWEIGACIYIQGISFLDNLYGVTESRESYAEKYESQDEERSPEDMSVRHTYRLDRGFFVRRLQREPPSFYIENTEQEIREALLDRHEKVWINRPGKPPQ